MMQHARCGPAGAVRAAIQAAPTTENGSGYACRGGLYIRPNWPAIPTAGPVIPAAWFGGVWAPRPTVRIDGMA